MQSRRKREAPVRPISAAPWSLTNLPPRSPKGERRGDGAGADGAEYMGAGTSRAAPVLPLDGGGERHPEGPALALRLRSGAKTPPAGKHGTGAQWANPFTGRTPLRRSPAASRVSIRLFSRGAKWQWPAPARRAHAPFCPFWHADVPESGKWRFCGIRKQAAKVAAVEVALLPKA